MKLSFHPPQTFKIPNFTPTKKSLDVLEIAYFVYLDFIKGVNNEHIDEILSGTVEPVVEWSSALGKLQVEAVHTLQNLENNTD